MNSSIARPLSNSASLANVAKGLLVTINNSISSAVQMGLARVGISTETCADSASCQHVLGRRKFEIAFVDFALGADAELAVDNLRASPTTKNSVIVAITENSEQAKRAFTLGVTFQVRQPISDIELDNVLRAAYGLVLRERRRYFRCYVDAPVLAYRATETAWRGQLANISEDGMCITAPLPLIAGEGVNVEAKIPSSTIEISARCEVLWSDASYRTGLRFLDLPPGTRGDLNYWLTDQLELALANRAQ